MPTTEEIKDLLARQEQLHRIELRLADLTHLVGVLPSVETAMASHTYQLGAIQGDNQRHAETMVRLFSRVEGLEEWKIEVVKELPILQLTSRWTLAGVIAIVGLAGLLVWNAITGMHA